MKVTLTHKVVGYIIFLLMAFAVFFDPTEMALGAKFITLPTGLLSIAEVLGNVTWVIGILYCLIAIGSLMTLFNSEVYDETMVKAKANGDIKHYRKKWFELPLFFIVMSMAIVALGSGFWFTGSAWILALLLVKAVKQKVRNDENIDLEAK